MMDPQEAQTEANRFESALQEARAALQGGDRTYAYRLSIEATRNTPGDISAWLLRAKTAPTLEEAANCLNQANALQPGSPEINQVTYRIVKTLLEQNPQLKYLDETDEHYRVLSSEHISLIVPKDGPVKKVDLAGRSNLFQSTYRWLGLAALGLLPGGVGAIVFAPLAGLTALRLNLHPLSRHNRIHSLMLILISAGLWLFGLLLSVILLVHII